MGAVDYIAIAAIVLIVGAAVFYIVRAKKRGEKCVGCPHSKQCGGKCGCGHSETDEDK
ncbi:MAG: FeoB-associated Cys-rich membrane protein [Clostridia bacterium]|nr:FeoB-associated Cys-rich membrane protein [Clostridia bacterium]